MAKKRDIIQEVKDSAKATREKPQTLRRVKSGCTVLDLACSDTTEGAYQLGTMVRIVGDSSSGKTFGALTCFAEAGNDSYFDEFEFIFDDAEHRNNFNMEGLFGKKIADRVKPPFGYDDEGDPISSETIEDFQDSVFKHIDSDIPCIYVLDSMDALDSEGDLAKFKSGMKKRAQKRDGETVKAEAGSYGMIKAKTNSEILRRICGRLRKTRSLLIIISQTRDNIGFGFTEQTCAGGRALKFYCTHEIWMAVKKTLVRSKIQIGVTSGVSIKKNSLTGKLRKVDFNIYYDYGLDDIGSMIDLLLELEYWKKVKNSIEAKEFNVIVTQVKLIELIESDPKNITKLKQITKKQWLVRERNARLGRKKRFV